MPNLPETNKFLAPSHGHDLAPVVSSSIYLVIQVCVARRSASASIVAGIVAVAPAAGVVKHSSANGTLLILPNDPQYLPLIQRFSVVIPFLWNAAQVSPAVVQSLLAVQAVPELASIAVCPVGILAVVAPPVMTSIGFS